MVSIQRGWAKLPPVLVLHLNRTSWVTGCSRKVPAHVSFPLEGLALKKWCPAATAEYDLFAVVLHHGRSMQEGHYSAYVRSGGHGHEATWWHMNDAKVSRATEDEVRAASAYLLFYQVRAKAEDEGRQAGKKRALTAAVAAWAFHAKPAEQVYEHGKPPPPPKRARSAGHGAVLRRAKTVGGAQ